MYIQIQPSAHILTENAMQKVLLFHLSVFSAGQSVHCTVSVLLCSLSSIVYNGCSVSTRSNCVMGTLTCIKIENLRVSSTPFYLWSLVACIKVVMVSPCFCEKMISTYFWIQLVLTQKYTTHYNCNLVHSMIFIFHICITRE